MNFRANCKKHLSKIDPFFLMILTLSFLLRFLFLDKIPSRVDGDASRIALDSIRAWQEKWPVFGTGWSGYGNISFYFIGFFLRVFGKNILGIRIFSAIGGILEISAVYLLAKKFFGGKIAFYSAFFSLFSFFPLVFSRIGLDISWAVFFLTITVYLFLSDKWWVNLISGFVLGFSQYFYSGVKIIPILLIILAADLLIFKKRKVGELIKASVLMGIGFLMVYGPMIHYFFSHPAEYWARSKIVGIFQSGWFEQENRTRSFFDIIFTQFKNCFLVFWIPVKAGAYFWVFKTPYLEKTASILFSLGLLKSFLLLKRKYQYSFLLVYFFLGVILAGVLTVNSPTASRYAMIFPAVSIFFGLGLDWLIRFVPQKIKLLTLSFILIIFMTEGLFLYWNNEFKKSFQYDTNTQVATFAGRYLSQKTGDYQIYFLGNSNLYYDAVPTLPFLTQRRGIDIYLPIEKFTGISEGKNYFIILSERKADLEKLEKTYSQGKTLEFKNPPGDLLFYLFEK